MTNRREFLHAAAAAVPAAALAPGFTGATHTCLRPRDGTRAVLAALIDPRHPESRALARYFAIMGESVHELPQGDITPVWREHLLPAWRREPIAVVGLTSPSALFCLEMLSASHGLRVAFHAEHIVHSDGHTEHSLLRGAAARVSARDLQRADSRWPATIARALADYPLRSNRPLRGPSDAALDPALPAGAKLVTSWIIAAA